MYYYISDDENNRINSGYLLASTILHAAFFGLLILLATQTIKEQKKIEVIEIQFASSVPAIKYAPPKGVQQEIASPESSKKESKSLISSAIVKSTKSPKAIKSSGAKAKSLNQPQLVSDQQILDDVMSDIPKSTAHQNNMDEPEPEIPNEDDNSNSSDFSSDLAENDLSDDLSDIEAKTKVKAKSANKVRDEIENHSNQFLNEQNDNLSKEQQRIANAKAAKIGAARSQADKNIKGILAAGNGNGSNDQNSNGVASSPYGVPTGVRKLEQLRQMPGNKKPEYTILDRRNRKQGDVVYLAYISKSGTPTRFVLAKSTGFESLDDNTLTALKKWKFYPGQEGWVELPFSWNLKGGVQEAPSQLRRNLSQK